MTVHKTTFIVHFAVIAFACRYCESIGLPCSVQHTMRPIRGKAQEIGENPPPYKFYVLNSRNEPVKYYKNNVYTIVLNSSTSYFRGFLMQARLSTRQGHVIGHLRAGQFLPDDSWEEQGIQIQKCPPVFNDSITNSNGKDKRQIAVKWNPRRNDGAVQFVLTIIQETETFWVQWSPETGLIFADNDAKFTEEIVFPLKGDLNENTKGESKVIISSGLSHTSNKSLNSFPEEKNLSSVGEATKNKGHAITAESEASLASEQVTKEAEFISTTLDSRTVTKGGSEVASEKGASETTKRGSKEESDTENIGTENKETTDNEIFTSPSLEVETSDSFKTDSTDEETDKEKSKEIRFSTETTLNDDFATSSTKKPFSIRILTQPPEDQSDEEEEVEHVRIFSSGEKVDKSSHKNKTIKKPSNEIDYCFDFPCFNNGTCNSIASEKRYQCVCTEEWLGDQCLDRNYCLTNPCKNGGSCVNTEDGPSCKCDLDWTGDLCETSCPSYVCENNATCFTNKKTGEYMCDCKPGWSGLKCEKNINECESNPCFHGGTCIDRVATFECKCPPGYMGQRCHRPCQDIYRSCDSWRDEDRCEIMRPTTKFFDINCAKTCDQCVYDNETVKTSLPLPPVLEPFEFLLGSWNINYTGRDRFPLDFQNAHFGYYEELNFFISNVTMFGTPFINYTTMAINIADKSDVQLNVGFMTLKPSAEPIKVSIMSTGNDGVTVIEEGLLKGKEMNLTTEYFAVYPSAKSPKKTLRRFVINGKFLEENIIRISEDGSRKSFTKYYYRLADSNSY